MLRSLFTSLSIAFVLGCAVTDAADRDGGRSMSPDSGLDDASLPDDAALASDAEPPRDATLPPDGSVTAACTGRAPSCFGRDYGACSIGLGCASAFRCLGFAARCIEQPTEVACGEVVGCAWDGASARCMGAQRACATFDDTAACEAQPGCAGGSSCSGTITACDQLDEETCETQLGCARTDSVGRRRPATQVVLEITPARSTSLVP